VSVDEAIFIVRLYVWVTPVQGLMYSVVIALPEGAPVNSPAPINHCIVVFGDVVLNGKLLQPVPVTLEFIY
jgi:hypothetical protein